MKMQWACISVFLVGLSSIFSTISQAQNRGENSEVLPVSRATGSVELADGRKIKVHRGLGSTLRQDPDDFVFFHRPIFLFRESDGNNIAGVPKIVWKKTIRGDDIYYNFKIAVTNHEIIAKSEELVKRRSIELLRLGEKISNVRISIEKWPLKLVRFVIRDPVERSRVYSEYVSDDLSSSGDELSIWVGVNKELVPEFEALLNDGNIQFLPYYSSDNIKHTSAIASAVAAVNVSQAVANIINSEKVKETDPLFARQIAKIESSINSVKSTSVSGTSVELVKLLHTSISSSAILTSDWLIKSEFEDDANLLSRFGDYLGTAIADLERERVHNFSQADTQTTTRDKDLKLDAKFAGIGVTPSLSKQEVDKLERTYGVKLTETEDKKVLEVHSIQLSYLRSGYKNIIEKSSRDVFLRLGVNANLEEHSPFFVTSTIGNKANQSRRSSNRVHLGMMLCYFGKEIPDGYVVANGSTKWPNESWVPNELRNASIPDMRKRVAVGKSANDALGVAIEFPPYQLTGAHVNGGGFEFPTERFDFLTLGSHFRKQDEGNTVPRMGRAILNMQGPSGGSAKFGDVFTFRHESFSRGGVSGRVPVRDIKIPRDTSTLPPHVPCNWIVRVN